LKIGYFGAYIYRDALAEENLFFAPVHIPDGVIIKWVRLHYWDKRAENIECRLYRSNKFTETWEIIYVVFSSGNENGVRHTTKIVPYCTACTLTNIGVCNYYVTIDYKNAFNASLRVLGITIGYEELP